MRKLTGFEPRVRCHACSGEGAREKSRCPVCHGTGEARCARCKESPAVIVLEGDALCQWCAAEMTFATGQETPPCT